VSTDTRAPTGNPRFRSLPSTRTGRVTTLLFAITLLLALLNAVLVMPYTESRTGLDAFQQAYNLVAGLFVVATGIVGIVSITRSRERSWAVMVPVVLSLAVIVLVLSDMGG